MKNSVILLAGGIGTRMQSETPKQFLLLGQKPIALYSFELFCSLKEFQEIVVACAESYQPLFQETFERLGPAMRLEFAPPGETRQESVFYALQHLSNDPDYVCIHDAARPFVTASAVRRTLEAAHLHGAAACGIPLKSTIKKIGSGDFVEKTPERSSYWEVQTPQIIETGLIKQGFVFAMGRNLLYSDDVSLVEQLKKPVKLVRGSENNIKITTPCDLKIAQALLESEACSPISSS